MAITYEDTAYQAWLVDMQAKGLLPPEVRRVILDVPLNGIVRMYVESNADEATFTKDLLDIMARAQIVTVGDKQEDTT